MNSVQQRYVDRVRKWCPQVNKVADSTKPVVIVVTKRDVSKASKKDPENCAMACSFKREGWDAAIIQARRAYLVKGDLAVRYEVPESVTREIVSFDRNADFRPGEYRLSRIQPCNRFGKRSDATSARSERTRRPKPFIVRRHQTEGIR